MALMKGEPLVRKLAVFAKYVVLPGAMAAALVYSPPDYAYFKNDDTHLMGVLVVDLPSFLIDLPLERPSDHVELALADLCSSFVDNGV
ncbi:hypothetical protein SDJN02_01603, partial [Cucurbita argyrosperma subsp. argyrosperma]